jgi:hypothetical protein
MAAQGAAAVRSAFDRELYLDAGDYAGILRIQTVTTELIYRSTEEQIERTVVVPGLPSEDVIQLPEYDDFLVASDEELDATVLRTLKRVAVSWETVGFDEDGRPSSYDATVVFRGTQRSLVPDYHMATAEYAGVIPARPSGQTVLASYEAAPGPSVQLPATVRPVEVAEEPVPLSPPTLSIVPLVIAAASTVIMLLALLLCLYFFLYRNARLVEAFPTGKRTVLARKHLRLEGGEAVFSIDPAIALYRDGVTHLICLNRQLAGRQGHLVVLWGDRQVLRVGLQRETDVTQELIKSLEEGLGQQLMDDRELLLAFQGEKR